MFNSSAARGALLLRRTLDAALALVLLGPVAVGFAALSGLAHRWPDLLAQFPAPALAVAAAGTLAAVLARLKLAGLVAGLGLAVLAAALWGQAAPPRPAAAGEARVRIYAANLHEANDDVARVAASIAAADADVVVLVEVGPAVSAGIDRVLAGDPHRAPERIGPRANVVASRAPLQPLRGRPDGLSARAARVETALGPITVFATHLTRPWPFEYQWGQISQVMALEARMAASEGPFVVAGDFNSVTTGRIGRQVRALGLNPEPGFPGTWPASAPAPARLAIDHVYASPELTIVSRRLGRPTGSDHSPVIVELARAAPPSPR